VTSAFFHNLATVGILGYAIMAGMHKPAQPEDLPEEIT
jgi:hypothetical protein